MVFVMRLLCGYQVFDQRCANWARERPVSVKNAVGGKRATAAVRGCVRIKIPKSPGQRPDIWVNKKTVTYRQGRRWRASRPGIHQRS